MTDKEISFEEAERRLDLHDLKRKVDRLEKILLTEYNITDSVITRNEFWFMDDDMRARLRELKGE